MPTSLSPSSEQLGTPNLPAIRFTRGTSFGASRFTHLLQPANLLAPLYGSDRYARPSRAFTSRLPTDRLPSPLLDITTTATGLLCWRDSHPLEWQLASLHQNRTGGFPAYGSHLGCVTAKRSLGQGWRMIGFGSQSSTSCVIRSQVIRSFWLRRRSVRRQSGLVESCARLHRYHPQRAIRSRRPRHRSLAHQLGLFAGPLDGWGVWDQSILQH